MDINTRTNEALFDQVCELLHLNRRKRPHHTPLDTLNRLFVKYGVGQSRYGTDRPWLTSSNTLVTSDTRSKQDFVKLAVPTEQAIDDELPIVLIRHRGVERVLYGHERCRAWSESGDFSTHTALVLVVQDS